MLVCVLLAMAVAISPTTGNVHTHIQTSPAETIGIGLFDKPWSALDGVSCNVSHDTFVVLSATQRSALLVVRNLDIVLPHGAVVTSVRAEWTVHIHGSGTGNTRESEVAILPYNTSAIQTRVTTRIDGNTPRWSNVSRTITYPLDGDPVLWGGTHIDASSAQFGVSIRITNFDLRTVNASVQCVKVLITYNDISPPTTGVSYMTSGLITTGSVHTTTGLQTVLVPHTPIPPSASDTSSGVSQVVKSWIIVSSGLGILFGATACGAAIKWVHNRIHRGYIFQRV